MATIRSGLRGTALAAMMLGVVLACGAMPALAQQRALMVLGTPHFHNPGKDTANVQVDDVLAPARQAQIETVLAALAQWKPDHLAVEWPADDQAALDKRYADYRAGHYVLGNSEIDQLGLRLAARLNLPRVIAVDTPRNASPPGPQAEYDYAAWAQANGRSEALAELRARWSRDIAAYSNRNRCRPVADWLREANAPGFRAAIDRPYFDIALLGDARANPGAAWVSGWHLRNLRIYANLAAAVPASDGRTLAIFGFGHATLLNAFAEQSGRFALVDPLAWLPPSSPSTCR